VNSVIVGPEKFREDIDISIGILMCEIFIVSIANRAMHVFHYRTFQVGFRAHLKLNAFIP